MESLHSMNSKTTYLELANGIEYNAKETGIKIYFSRVKLYFSAFSLKCHVYVAYDHLHKIQQQNFDDTFDKKFCPLCCWYEPSCSVA